MMTNSLGSLPPPRIVYEVYKSVFLYFFNLFANTFICDDMC